MSNFTVTVRPIAERESAIANEKLNSKRTQRFYEYRNNLEDLPVIRIPIELPIYRVANYRTSVTQLRWIRERGLSDDFFSSGEENESVQRVQHSFLWDLAQTQKETIASIIDRLKSEGQREPILITASGVIVNGNRRIAAMRELREEEPEAFGHFSFVDCMILPTEATEDDLKEIEVRLQMTPETRLPYDWLGECIAIKDLNERGKSFDTIGNWMRLEPSKVKNKLLLLNEVDLYLKDWKQKEADYDQLTDAEEIITQITKRIKNKDGLQQEMARRIGWILLDQRGREGRIYELRDVTGNLLGAVVEKIQEVYSNEISDESSSENENKPTFELSFEETDEDNNEQAIISFLDTSKNNDQLQEDLLNICKVVVETKKLQKSGEAARRAAQDAHTSLLEVDLSSADKSTYNSIKRHLDSIEQRVKILQKQLEQLMGTQKGNQDG